MGALSKPLYRKLEPLSSFFSLNFEFPSNLPNGMPVALIHRAGLLARSITVPRSAAEDASCTDICTATARVAPPGAPEIGQEEPRSSLRHGICSDICPGPTMDPECPREGTSPRAPGTRWPQDQVNVEPRSSKSTALLGQVRGSPLLTAFSRSTGPMRGMGKGSPVTSEPDKRRCGTGLGIAT